MSAFSLSVAFAGCFIGAGFLSGQEIWQFFGSFGLLGIVGLFIAIFIQLVLGYVVVNYAAKTKVNEFDKLIIRKENKPLRLVFAIFEIIFIFFILSIMFAGAGSLFYSVLNISSFWTSMLFAIIVMVVAYCGLEGLVKIFSFTIPLLTVTTIIVSIMALAKYGLPNLVEAQIIGKTTLMPNFLVACVLFAVHNLFCTLGIIVPLGEKIQSRKTVFLGVVIACFILLVLAFAVVLPIYANTEYAKSELPILDVCKDAFGWIYYVYAFLMLLGMFGCSVSSVVAISDFTNKKISFFCKNKMLLLVVVGILAFAISNVGFSGLISVLYPLTGYVGAIAFILIVVNYIKDSKKSTFDRQH